MRRLLLVILAGCSSADDASLYEGEGMRRREPTQQTAAGGTGVPPLATSAPPLPIPPPSEQPLSVMGSGGVAGAGGFPVVPPPPSTGGAPGAGGVAMGGTGSIPASGGSGGSDTGGVGGAPQDCDQLAWDCLRDLCDGSTVVDDSDARPWDPDHPLWRVGVPGQALCKERGCVEGITDSYVQPFGVLVNDGAGLCFRCDNGNTTYEDCP